MPAKGAPKARAKPKSAPKARTKPKSASKARAKSKSAPKARAKPKSAPKARAKPKSAPKTTAKRADPALWEEIKEKWHRGGKGGPAGKWNARKAMLATKEYKQRGGRYVGKRDPNNSLKKWEKEKWGYIDGNKKGRYLPEKVRQSLTPAEKKRENSLKRGKKGKNISYSRSVNEKMREAGVY